MTLSIGRSVLYTKNMKKINLLFPVVTCLFVGVLFSPADAQRAPKFKYDFFKVPKSARSLYRQRNAMQDLAKMDRELSSIKNIQPSKELLEEMSKFNLTNRLLSTLQEAALPYKAEKMVKDILESECTSKRDDVEAALEKLWRLQDRYGDHGLFPIFAKQYYSHNFGALSTHVQDLFDRIGMLHDRDLELKFIKRLHFISRNKITLSKGLFSDKKIFLPKKSFRVRYLSNIGKLTPDNFQESQLVLSIERSMSPNPAEDFPIRHVSGRSVVNIDQKVYPVYGFTAPLDGNIASLYTYLLYGQNENEPLSAIYDKKGQSLALFNKDKSLWLRVSPHEYAEPDNLHLHLNELRPVTFTTKNGDLFDERVNFNLSIPLSTPMGGPIISTKDFFYHQLISKPVEILRRLPNVTIKERPIY